MVEASRLGGVKERDFVLYKEERVGAVVSTALSNDSRAVRIHLNILSRYADLVRTNSVFWTASGISADLGLTGLHATPNPWSRCSGAAWPLRRRTPRERA